MENRHTTKLGKKRHARLVHEPQAGKRKHILLAENFGVSLKRISEKLDAVDKRTKEVDRQNDVLAKKIEDLKGVPKKGEASSNEKRKHVLGVNSPAAERQKSQPRSRSGGIKMRQPRIEVSSDKEAEKGRAKNAAIEEPPLENKLPPSTVNLEDVMKMLAIIAGKVNQGQNDNDTGVKMESRSGVKTSCGVANASTKDNSEGTDEEEEEKLMVNRGGLGGRAQVGIVEYMRHMLDHYMKMTGKKIKMICLERDVKWERKDKSAWELAKQDTEEFTKLMNGGTEEEDGAESTCEEDEEDANGSDNDDCQGDVQGN
ncbi:hypothetical protein CBR_g31332 [Chara braunii]|uniref:Uncharacterized protein n=1 Tax=Chara braunii TaxID=69332 RepID=A0A388LEU2_CHABU|nr:hypothetical protein CBR_g31332 [Chara braunii]|eukprot:GBG80777.1 hypothetical protein CBR_g31332 [Chara braunii]